MYCAVFENAIKQNKTGASKISPHPINIEKVVLRVVTSVFFTIITTVSRRYILFLETNGIE